MCPPASRALRCLARRIESLTLRPRQHAELTAFVDELQTRRDCIGEGSRDQFDMFMTWARIHLDASNPFNGLEFPSGASPDTVAGLLD